MSRVKSLSPLHRSVVGLTSLGFLASAAVISMGAMTPSITAYAGEGDQCYVSTITLNNVENSDAGIKLNNGLFRVNLPTGIYGVAGDTANTVGPQWKKAFDDEIAKTNWLTTTDAGKAWAAASQAALGTTNHPGYPTDITDVNASVRVTALADWQKDAGQLIEKTRADAQRRLDAIDKALSANPELQKVDKPSYDHAVAQKTKLTTLLSNLNTAKTTKDWAAFTKAYDAMVNPANWSYGLAKTVSVQYQDQITKTEIAKLNEVVGAKLGKNTFDVRITKDGQIKFVIFGMNAVYSDAGTRGDNTCEQLTGRVTQVTPPPDHDPNPDPKDFTSTPPGDNGEPPTGTVTIPNDKSNRPKPPAPRITTTGI